jgi:biopolymer transport protein ExbD
MRTPNALRTPTIGFNMTPMIDIVFLLIIFFLVTNHLTNRETEPDIDLPSAQSGQEVETENPNRLIVNINADGGLAVEGRTLSLEELQGLIATRRDALGQDMEVQLRGHRDSPYRFVEPVLVASAMQGVWNVKIRVYRREE